MEEGVEEEGPVGFAPGLATQEELKRGGHRGEGGYEGDPQVVDKSSKTSQGNRGDHLFERNLDVHLHREPNLALEFELTRNNHNRDPRVPYTVTACFKDPPTGFHEEAWRILRHVTRGKELMPAHADDYTKKNFSGRLAPGSAGAGGTEAGSPPNLDEGLRGHGGRADRAWRGPRGLVRHVW